MQTLFNYEMIFQKDWLSQNILTHN